MIKFLQKIFQPREVFVQINQFYNPEDKGYQDCVECMRKAQEQADQLGMSVDSFSDECKERCQDYNESKNVNDLPSYPVLVRPMDIKTLSRSTKDDRLIIELYWFPTAVICDNNYYEFMDRVKDHVEIV